MSRVGGGAQYANGLMLFTRNFEGVLRLLSVNPIKNYY